MVSSLNLQILEDLKDFDKDFLFLNKSIKLLKKRYSNKFIVIKDGEVKSSGDTINDAIEKARKKGIIIEKAIIEFIPKKEEILIL